MRKWRRTYYLTSLFSFKESVGKKDLILSYKLFYCKVSVFYKG